MDREQEQRERAYKIWEDEGRPIGKHEEHWAQAALGEEGQDERSQGNDPGATAIKPARRPRVVLVHSARGRRRA